MTVLASCFNKQFSSSHEARILQTCPDRSYWWRTKSFPVDYKTRTLICWSHLDLMEVLLNQKKSLANSCTTYMINISTYNTINRKIKAKLLPKNEHLRMKVIHKHKETFYISVITDAILDQKRLNICEHAVMMAPCKTLTLRHHYQVFTYIYSHLEKGICPFHFQFIL